MVGGPVSTRINRHSRTGSRLLFPWYPWRDTLTARGAPAPRHQPGRRPSPSTPSAPAGASTPTSRWVARCATGSWTGSGASTAPTPASARTRSSPRSPPPPPGRFEFPEDSVALFDLYDRLVTATDGAVDPLVGRQLELLGYDPTYSSPRPDAVRDRERSGTADLGGGHHPRRHHPHHPAPARAGCRSGRQGLPRRHHLSDPPARRGGPVRRRRRRRPAPPRRARHPGRAGTPARPAAGDRRGQPPDGALCASVNRRAWGNGLHHVLDAERAHRPPRSWPPGSSPATPRSPTAWPRRCSSPARTGSPRPAGSPTCGCSPTAAPNARQLRRRALHADRTAQNDPGHDDHRDLRRCGHRRMRDDGHRRHNCIVGPEHQRRRPGLTLQPTLEIRRRHLHRNRPIRQPSLKHRRVRHPRR